MICKHQHNVNKLGSKKKEAKGIRQKVKNKNAPKKLVNKLRCDLYIQFIHRSNKLVNASVVWSTKRKKKKKIVVSTSHTLWSYLFTWGRSKIWRRSTIASSPTPPARTSSQRFWSCENMLPSVAATRWVEEYRSVDEPDTTACSWKWLFVASGCWWETQAHNRGGDSCWGIRSNACNKPSLIMSALVWRSFEAKLKNMGNSNINTYKSV